MISRRDFFTRMLKGFGISLLIPPLQSCIQPQQFPGKIVGPNAALGHRLRSMDFPSPVETTKISTLIVGGGVAGLSAARYLKKFKNDFLLIELEEHTGGNAIGGNNRISAFPWGAHYLPLPGTNDPELLQFLEESAIITGWKNDLPVYNEYDLCHDPKERLYINHFWQDNLIPQEGVPAEDRQEIERFLAQMHDYKSAIGKDGRQGFAIPVELSSQDEELISLDAITAEEFLAQNNFTSSYLRWYVEYCCADDYGSSLQQTSAWAMVHYFASRNGKAANASSDAVLTWPEGNYRLVKLLQQDIQKNIIPGTLAYSVTMTEAGVEVIVFDAVKNLSRKIIAKNVILATPQFINQRLLNISRNIDYTSFHYAPWMVANILVDSSLQEKKGEQLCWDNVIYGSDALGYVNASHQYVGVPDAVKAITYYKPLLKDDPASERKNAFSKSFDSWKNEILQDLRIPHPQIAEAIKEMNVWIWGHGMIKPSPGFIWSANRMNAFRPIDNKIFFAHSDLGGLSIFEEAFYHGHKSAEALLRQEKLI